MQRKISESLAIIANSVERYPKIAVASSFGKDSVVLLHLCRRIDPNIKVFSVMTPFKPQETLDYKKMLTELWNLNIETFDYTNVVDASCVESKLYETDPDYCCEVYKVAPVKTAIEKLGLEAWMAGLRNTEGHTRKFIHIIEEKNGLYKINPILHWTEEEVWLYHALNNIPVHPLYARGYRSLGCTPCSQPYTKTERGGRWVGTCKEGGECGIHSKSLK